MTPTHPPSGHETRHISQHIAGPTRTDQTQLLVGHDDHPESRAAVRTAGNLAKRLDAHLHVVHVVDMEDMPIDADTAVWDETVQQTLEQRESEGKHLLANTDIDWTYHVSYGDPANVIAALAAQFEVLFIIVGAPQRSLIRRFMEGSTAHRLLHHQPKSVLFVKAGEHDT